MDRKIEKDSLQSDLLINNRHVIATILMLAASILTIITALIGVLYSDIYMDLVLQGQMSNFVAAGAINQDLLSIPCGVALFVLSIMNYKRRSYKLLVFALGLVGYIFYGYAVYTFGIMRTPLYLAYIAIFILSVYSLIMGLLSFNSKKVYAELGLSKHIGKTIGLFLIIMVSILSLKWVVDILQGNLQQTQPELYLIAAMDLGLALPAIGVAAVMLLRSKAYGILLSGIALVKIFTLCLSVAIGTFIAPYFDLKPDYSSFAFFSALALVSLVLKILYLRGMRRSVS